MAGKRFKNKRRGLFKSREEKRAARKKASMRSLGITSAVLVCIALLFGGLGKDSESNSTSADALETPQQPFETEATPIGKALPEESVKLLSTPLATVELLKPTPELPAATPTLQPTPVPMGYINARSLNMRSEPNRSSDIVQEYNEDQKVELIGESGDWYETRVDDNTGYMLKEYITLSSDTDSLSQNADSSADTAAVSEGYINANSLNMRLEPSRDCDIVQEYSKDQKVEITGESGDWYQVRVGNKSGYMLKEYIVLAAAYNAAKQAESISRSATVQPVATAKPQDKAKATEEPITRSQTGKYVGSIEQNKFHYPNCQHAKKILPSNEVWWNSRDEAVAAGRESCGTCNP